MATPAKPPAPLMPFSMIVGQRDLKLALKLAFIDPRIGGVLISGQRGTGKSTAVRAFARIVYPPERPLVTLPINATEDRVVGGWKIDALMRGRPVKQRGLLEEADGSMLYVDEVNLLDDHIVNIILDVASTGLLSIQREGRADADRRVSFSLVGTMNPEEGNLRPQLLDRFGLMVDIKAIPDRSLRAQILTAVLDFDRAVARARAGMADTGLERARQEDEDLGGRLAAAVARYRQVKIEAAVELCARLVSDPHFTMQGHRGDLVLLLAARALAALRDEPAVGPEHLRAVAQMALQHRRLQASQGVMFYWAPGDDAKVAELLGIDPAAPTIGDLDDTRQGT